MPNKRILYVTSEMFPYQEGSSIATMVNNMAIKTYKNGNDVRVFMPRYGTVSERKFQLHEVIRLSGMNIIVNDLDQPLIIKVASIPGERLQVYFIDNEDYFRSKNEGYVDADGNPYSDNDERAIFYARGVIETVKKLNWVPDIIHLNGWLACFLPIYLKYYYKNDMYFADSKLVTSVYNEKNNPVREEVKQKLKFDKITNLDALKEPNFYNFLKDSLNLSDLIIRGNEFLEPNLDEMFNQSKTEKSEFIEGASVCEIYDRL